MQQPFILREAESFIDRISRPGTIEFLPDHFDSYTVESHMNCFSD